MPTRTTIPDWQMLHDRHAVARQRVRKERHRLVESFLSGALPEKVTDGISMVRMPFVCTDTLSPRRAFLDQRDRDGQGGRSGAC